MVELKSLHLAKDALPPGTLQHGKMTSRFYGEKVGEQDVYRLSLDEGNGIVTVEATASGASCYFSPSCWTRAEPFGPKEAKKVVK